MKLLFLCFIVFMKALWGREGTSHGMDGGGREVGVSMGWKNDGMVRLRFRVMKDRNKQKRSKANRTNRRCNKKSIKILCSWQLTTQNITYAMHIDEAYLSTSYNTDNDKIERQQSKQQVFIHNSSTLSASHRAS